MVMVMVGATIVGAIGTSWHGDVKRSKELERFDYSEQFLDKIISQGSEMGYFKLGSTVVLLFANGEKYNGIKNYWLVARFSWVNQWQLLLN